MCAHARRPDLARAHTASRARPSEPADQRVSDGDDARFRRAIVADPARRFAVAVAAPGAAPELAGAIRGAVDRAVARKAGACAGLSFVIGGRGRYFGLDVLGVAAVSRNFRVLGPMPLTWISTGSRTSMKCAKLAGSV